MKEDNELSNKQILEEIDTMIWRLNGFRSLIARRIEDERKTSEKTSRK